MEGVETKPDAMNAIAAIIAALDGDDGADPVPVGLNPVPVRVREGLHDQEVLQVPSGGRAQRVPNKVNRVVLVPLRELSNMQLAVPRVATLLRVLHTIV